ncbi:hypothetical protein ACFSQD_00730 [Flavihumibacter stibioxidans]|uniref:Uncharacterized protein n=1 Tax=Flavihumibacter stibioxidans TaxID=1834163 RepID=A0ABR7MEG2_9BACT|nr:hypothetical protein [Flavihumibacter stibioxidans]MBC6493026.1 hypothetical protein [Flavihumibacter stibioxidans]
MMDENFGNLNRSAIVLAYKQPFADWLNSQEKDFTFNLADHESDIYLLPDFETPEEMEKRLNKNFDLLFTPKLFGWYMDESMWPQNRTFNMFQNWFHYTLHTMIFDTQKAPIQKF